ncbi:hypothetical protein QBC38DRAFT_479015 [Podospora fimiseda]|uniref:AT hook domain-containing protein n=1 Tax=Podospora fimiseda TaxID=252190 RepID=A0AAN7BPA4_9PEZI|nr:hypothetical protein QBC38DRAFT_479015 [Podospora fimiseda]
MATSKRVILDSEDDDSDFEETPNIGGDIDQTETEKRHETIIPQTRSTAETDSSESLFARVYNQAVDLMHPPEGENFPESRIPDTLPSSESLSTVIPDTFPPTEPSLPMPSSTRKSGRARTKTQKETETIDLRTPSKAIDTDTVWDVPSSQVGGSARSSRSSARAKRNRTADTTTQDPYEFPEGTPAPNKRAKRGQPTNEVDSSPIILVPTDTPSSLRLSTRSSNTSAAALDTSNQLYVAQSELTTSQIQQYEVVNVSSQNGMEAPQPSLPALPADLGEVTHKSSGATVRTIAYTTPSHFGSSRQDMPSTAGPGDASMEEAPVTLENQPEQSSPDVLTDIPTSTAAKKRGRKKAAFSSAPTNSSSAPRAKKRKVVYGSDDDADELDGAYGDEEIPEPPVEEPQDTVDETFAPEVEAELMVEIAAPPPEPAAKKKRGRKKKDPTPVEPVPQLEEPSFETPVVEEAEEPPSKKRRGRPRRSEVAKAPTPEVESEPVEPEPLARAPRNTQRGRKKKTEEEKEEEQEEEAYKPEPGPGDDVKENKKQEMKPVEQPVTKTKEEKKPAKEKTAADVIAATNKVQYRVGLSKRSRIAPLLKSLKKP